MANRIVATYQGDDDTHTINFSPATPGARLILVATAWFQVEDAEDSTGASWVEDEYVFGWDGAAIFSKVATGAETWVRFYTEDVPAFAVLYERDDCGERVFSRSSYSSTSTLQTSSVNVPPLAEGRVFAVAVSPGGSLEAVTWNQGLEAHHAPTALDLHPSFAHGPMPEPGNKTFRVTGLPSAPDDAVLVVVGYGTADAVPPTVPGMLRATDIQDDTITVEWDPSTDDHQVAGYGVYRDGAKQGGDQTELSYTFTGLTTGQTYTLAVDAVDTAGNRSAKAEIVVMAVLDVVPPSPPPGLVVTGVTHTSVSVAWEPATDNVGVAGYGLYVGGSKVGPDQAELTATLTRLARDTTYTIGVDAIDAAGNRSAPAEIEVTTLAGGDPSAPPDLTATAGEEQITLAWGASEPGGDPIVRYEVLLDGQMVTSTASLGWVIEDLEAGGSYEVAVRAVDASSARGPVSTVSVVLPVASWTPIATPVFRLGAWAGNVRDESGVDWIVEQEEGWSAGASPHTLAAADDSDDGGFSGPGRYGSRVVTLSGRAVAPSRTAMLAAQDALTRELAPSEARVLRVTEGHLIRQARVRLESAIEITDQGSRVFEWTIAVKAADPRRYAVRPFHTEVEFEPAQTSGSAVVTLAGDYPRIPARLRLIGPVADPVISLGGFQISTHPGTVLPDERYELTIDLGTRQVWAIVPPEVWPEPRPGRGLLRVFPARAALRPGPNLIELAGEPVPGQEDKGPRLVIEGADAWI